MSFLNDLLGSTPTVPNLAQLDLGAEQLSAVRSNMAALPGAEALAGNVDQFNIGQIQGMMNQVMPGYSGLVSSASGNIGSELSGQVPTSVSGAAGRTLSARDLGLTSTDLSGMGSTNAQGWISEANRVYAPGQMNASSMFITPNQQAAFDTNQEQLQFQRQWMGNQIQAMGDPVTQGAWNTSMNVVDAIIEYLHPRDDGPGRWKSTSLVQLWNGYRANRTWLGPITHCFYA